MAMLLEVDDLKVESMFKLVDDDLGIEIEIVLDPVLHDTLAIQCSRHNGDRARNALRTRLSSKLESILLECLDWDLQPPSHAQVNFATAIARTLGIALPGEALRYKGTMNEYLDRHLPLYRQRGGTKTVPDGSPES